MILRGFGGVPIAPGSRAYDAAFINEFVQRAPDEWRGRLRSRYNARRSKRGEFSANTWLRETCETMSAGLLPLYASDDDVCAAADRLANECRRTAAGLCQGDIVKAHSVAVRFVEARGIAAPVPKDHENVGPALARMGCGSWWRRRLRALHGRTIEAQAVALGIVHGRPERKGRPAGERYVSDANATRRAQQRERNARTLAQVEAINQHGESFNLGELAERTTANPAIRRGELMTRIAGFEHVARDMGHAAEFWTGTAPSEFHSQGGENPRFAGATARDAQAWLVKSWARFRAWAGRRGVRLYGFRVAEPHQDGCPHWHLLLFMPAAFVARARARFRRYWLRMEKAPAVADTLKGTARKVAIRRAENADESRRRFACKFVSVEMSATRSAAGYIAKYISKNIDGYSVQKDLYGHDAVQGAARIDAWAATHGIRQFQQIGGAPVGPWRELRRLRKPDGMTGTLSAAHAAADVKGAAASQGWADYTMIQGGPLVRRADVRVRVAKTGAGMSWDAAQALPVPAGLNKYGEEASGQVWGVLDCARGVSVVTRVNAWEIRRRSSTGTGTSRAGFSARAAQPSAQSRTRVNNCTQPGAVREVSGPALPDDGAKEAPFLAGADLAQWAERSKLPPDRVAWWVARVAAGAACIPAV